MATIEERLRRLEDLTEIHHLFVAYGRHLDQGDWDAYADLFTEDGEVLLGPMGTARGRSSIRQLMHDTLNGRVGKAFHIVSSPAVQLAGDTATAEVMWTVLEQSPSGSPGVTMVGLHRDDLRRDGGPWRFTRRSGHLSLQSSVVRTTSR